MLYTIVSPDEVMAMEPSDPQLETVRLGSRLCEGVRSPNGFIISRMISTNPADYLNDCYSPGRRLKV